MVVTISKLFLPLDFLFQKACLTKCVNKTDLLAQFIITKLARTENFDSIRPQNSRVVLVDIIEISAKLCINLDNYRIKQGHFGAYGGKRFTTPGPMHLSMISHCARSTLIEIY